MSKRIDDLVIVPCPICLRGQAINKSAAYLAYNSKKYSKLRKSKQSQGMFPKPQVGKLTTVDGALTDPEILKAIAPPDSKSQQASYDKIETVGLCIVMSIFLTIELILMSHGYDRTILRLGTYALSGLLIYVLVKVAKVWYERQLQELQNYRRTWLCLQCGNEWIQPR